MMSALEKVQLPLCPRAKPNHNRCILKLAVIFLSDLRRYE